MCESSVQKNENLKKESYAVSYGSTNHPRSESGLVITATHRSYGKLLLYFTAVCRMTKQMSRCTNVRNIQLSVKMLKSSKLSFDILTLCYTYYHRYHLFQTQDP